MVNYKKIYNTQNKQYDLLVQHEDYRNNLLKNLQKIVNLKQKRIVEFGAGTGRLTFQLAKYAKEVRAFDTSKHMLQLAKEKLANSNYKNISFEVSDSKSVPVSSNWADISIEGWSFCHVLNFGQKDYKKQIDLALAEMERVTKKNGYMIIIETLGTSTKKPIIVNEWLGYFFNLLETKLDFSKKCIRTDYCFDNKKEAHKTLDFFFGSDLKFLKDNNKIVIPECTGVWWKQK